MNKTRNEERKCNDIVLKRTQLENYNIPKIEKNTEGWILSNNLVSCILNLCDKEGMTLKSLRNLGTGFDWADFNKTCGAYIKRADKTITGFDPVYGFKLAGEKVHELKDGVVQLEISVLEEQTGMKVTSFYSIYPGSCVIGCYCKVENIGNATISKIYQINPFCIRILHNDPLLSFYSYDMKKLKSNNITKFEIDISTNKKTTFNGWTAIENVKHNEILLIAGDQGGYVVSGRNEMSWDVNIEYENDSILIYAGIGAVPQYEKSICYELAPGQSIESPEVFISLVHGDVDNAQNALKYVLEKHILPATGNETPLLSYNVWYTDDAAEKLYLEDLEFASWMGFEYFVLDASWYEGSSIIPGTNDWAAGLGSYKESKIKFPRGMKYLSQEVHEKGMKFGIWVDPQNVDSKRVLSGEIPSKWVAQINGKNLESTHPTLSCMTQLCLGNPEVVEWLKNELARIIEEWHVDWIKWDPSGTVSYLCNRTDHGHAAGDGGYAHVKGRREIMNYLIKRFPHLSGWECIFDMRNASVNPINPRCKYILPAYANHFVTGPMVGPYVWGSLEYVFGTSDSEHSLQYSTYYEVSYLDYFFRRLMAQGGLSMGNITGLVSQRLKNAPPGFNDAFKRNIIHFKQYRHMFKEDIYRSKLLENEDKWHAVQYCARDASEAVVFIFRDGSPKGLNRLKLRGLDTSACYKLNSLNQRPGKEKIVRGYELVNEGLDVNLPDPYLATANYKLECMEPDVRREFEKQLQFGSDIIILTRID